MKNRHQKPKMLVRKLLGERTKFNLEKKKTFYKNIKCGKKPLKPRHTKKV